MGIGTKKKKSSGSMAKTAISNDEVGLWYAEVLERMDKIETKLDELLSQIEK